GKGIHNAMIIKLLRSLGLDFQVVAEQIEPLSKKDIQTIDQAQRFNFKESYENILKAGRERIHAVLEDPLIKKDDIGNEQAFQFIAGLEGMDALREYLLFRKIQEKKYLTADEAKKSTFQIMKIPQESKINIVDYLDDLLSPIQRDMAEIKNQNVDIICQNISGGLFGALNNRQLTRIFSKDSSFEKGETICQKDMLSREIYFVKKGKVKVFLEDNCVAILNEGEIFGEISLFYDIPRTATVISADEKTIIGILDRKQFRNIIRNIDENTKALIYRLYLFLPIRLRALNEKYKIVTSNLISLVQKKTIREELMNQTVNYIDEGKNIFQSNLTSKDIDELFTENRHCHEGELLFSEGDEADGAYLIKKGRIGIVSHSNDEEIYLAELMERDIFGEMALIDGEPRSADAKTMIDTILGFLPQKKYNQIINERSELSYRLMSSICLGLLGHIRRLDNIYLKVKLLIKQ
ncbi:MAG: cyclic nucleotide-binding domain-containing protein, partial [Thermodesulfobacteriota bacterium]|nr:cyclic nucleotide-binding domain-containing protein [Thermodesulfobacteriota bacterium]